MHTRKEAHAAQGASAWFHCRDEKGSASEGAFSQRGGRFSGPSGLSRPPSGAVTAAPGPRAQSLAPPGGNEALQRQTSGARCDAQRRTGCSGASGRRRDEEPCRARRCRATGWGDVTLECKVAGRRYPGVGREGSCEGFLRRRGGQRREQKRGGIENSDLQARG